MTDQGTIFNPEQPEQPAAQPEVKPDQTATPDQGVKSPDLNEVFADALSSIKNENGEQKYSDVFTALNALKHTQDHVRTLEEENRTFREESIKAKTMDEVLQQVTANKDQTVQTVPAGLDAESVKDVTLDTLRQYEAQKMAQANQQDVVAKLTNKFGSAEKAEEMFNNKAAELGLSVDFMNQLAASSPKAVLNYFDVKGEVTLNKNVEGSINTDALQAHQEPAKPRKNIMYGASSSEIVDAWRSAGKDLVSE